MIEQRVLSLDSQILNSIQNCARKTYYTFRQHLQTPDKAEPLERGDLMHKMFEIYYGLIGNCANPQSDTWTMLPADMWASVKHLQTKQDIVRFCIEAGRFYAGRTDLEIEDMEEVIYQFAEYCKYYEHEEWQPLAVEEVGSKILFEDESLKIIYNFKIDLIAENAKVIAPFDHKTGRRRSDPSSLSNQFLGYAYGIGSQHVIVNKVGFQKSLKPSERFQRYILTIDSARIEEWISNTVYWCRVLLASMDADSWPMNLTSCDKYSGCIYMKLCESDPGSRLYKIERDYKIGQEWDVALALEKI